jgi:hypothetical protein
MPSRFKRDGIFIYLILQQFESRSTKHPKPSKHPKLLKKGIFLLLLFYDGKNALK